MKNKPGPAARTKLARTNAQPVEADLKASLGRAYPRLEAVIVWLRSVAPALRVEDRFHMETGWHQIYLLRKRRLFYLTPKAGDFRFAMVLGAKAIAGLQQGPIAGQMPRLLKATKRYAEGTAFIFDRKSFAPSVVIALLEAKLAN